MFPNFPKALCEAEEFGILGLKDLMLLLPKLTWLTLEISRLSQLTTSHSINHT